MVTILQTSEYEAEQKQGGKCSPGSGEEFQRGYNGYVEPDTKIPPRAKPVLDKISVNGVAIDEAAILAEAQQHPADNPGEALIAAARALVIRELLLQEARSLGVNAEPETTENGLETSDDALIRVLIDEQVDTPVSDQTVRKRYYETNKLRFMSETIYEARHILLAVRDEKQRQGRFEQARALIEQLVENSSRFAKIAEKVSDCPSKNEGGNLGQLTTGSTVPEFESVLLKMEAGELWPEPVESDFGFHIIQLVNKIPGEVLPFEYVEEKIGAWLEASSWSKAVSQYITILAGKSKITGIELEGTSSPLVQ